MSGPHAARSNGLPALSIAREGLTLVSDGGTSPTVDIVFVHGLQGHARDTWLHTSKPASQPKKSKSIFGRRSTEANDTTNAPDSRTGDCFWPQELLAQDFPNARIFTYGYDSNVTNFFSGPADTSNILDRGRDLMTRVASQRSICLGRPLVFVVHSLGGIIVKAVSTLVLLK